MEDIATVAREGGLHRDLGKGQVIMISLGGAIGTTLFLSSGVALGYAALFDETSSFHFRSFVLVQRNAARQCKT